MSANKKFDKLVENKNYISEIFDESENNSNTKKKIGNIYSFKKAIKVAGPEKVYAVGFIKVYIAFISIFLLSAANSVLTAQGVFNGLSEYMTYAVSSAANVIVFLFPGVIFCILCRNGEHTYSVMGFKPLSLSYAPFTVLSFFVLIVSIAAGKFALAYFFSVNKASNTVFITDGSNILMYILVYAVIPAICEEAALRGVLQDEVTKLAGGISGIVISALIFALIHFDFSYFTVYIISGILLASIKHITGSVIPCIIVHTFNNVFSLFFSPRLTFIASERIGNAFIMVVFTVILFILLFFWLKCIENICLKKSLNIATSSDSEEDSNKDTLPYKFYSSPYKLTATTGYTLHKFLRVLFSPAIIVSVIIFLFITLM